MSSADIDVDRGIPDPEVVTFGEAMALMLAIDGQSLTTAQSFRRSVAGAESNVAIGLSRLGHRVAFAGRLGADAHGDVVLRALRAEGVDVRGVRRVSDRPTGLLLRDAPSGRPVTVAYFRERSAAAELGPDDVEVDQLRRAQLLHVTGITAAISETACAATEFAMDVAREAGLTVVFDPNIRLRLATPERWRELLDGLIRRADVVLAGLDEVELLTGEPGAVDWFLARGVSRVVVKEGAQGATETDSATSVHVPACPVPEVDPVGAGDAFAAGWISGWLRKLPCQRRLLEAAAVASCVVATLGDIEGLPDASTRDALIDNDLAVRR